MKTKHLPKRKKIKEAAQNRQGSEALEMVYAVAALCALILSTLLILGYALEVSAVTYAGKRVARYVEVSGVANEEQLQGLIEDLLDNAEEINADVDVTQVSSWFNYSSKKIQLRETFVVQVTATYKVSLINPGKWGALEFNVPIRVAVNGQSEVYWKS